VIDRFHVSLVGGPCHELNAVLVEPSHTILHCIILVLSSLKYRVAEHVVHLLVDTVKAALDVDIHTLID